MIPDSLDFIRRGTNEEQSEYAAAQTSVSASRKALDDFQIEPSAESLAKVQAEMDKLPAASSPAAGRNSEEAVRKGSQAASSGQTSRPQGLGDQEGTTDGKQGGVHPDRAREVAEGTSGRGLQRGPGVLDRSGPDPQERLGHGSGRGLTAAQKPPVSLTVPQGETGPRSSDAAAVGAPASEGPRWAPVDDERGDLLDLLANEHPAIPEEQRQWDHFVYVLKGVASINGGVIDQNLTRPLLDGEVTPQRIGPMFRRARREGLIEPDGYTTTFRSTSGNQGRPAPAYRYLGT